MQSHISTTVSLLKDDIITGDQMGCEYLKCEVLKIPIRFCKTLSLRKTNFGIIKKHGVQLQDNQYIQCKNTLHSILLKVIHAVRAHRRFNCYKISEKSTKCFPNCDKKHTVEG